MNNKKDGQEAVKKYLLAIDETVDPWIIQLAELILTVTDYDPAMAASRARDLSRQEKLARGLKDYISGWLLIKEIGDSGLTPLQQTTLHRVIQSMTEEINQAFSVK